MKNNKKSTVIPIFSSDCTQGALELKLNRELNAQSKLLSQSFLEDIYAVLLLSEWSDDVILRLLQTPSLLQEVAYALHNDDVFSMFFEQRVMDLTLELMETRNLKSPPT